MIKTATFYNAHPILQNKESYVKSSTLYIGHYGNVFLRLPEIILYVYVRKMIQANFDWIWSNGFREEFLNNLCWMTKDDKWWQKLTWPKWSGELKIKVNDDRRQVIAKGHLLFGQLR
jgi:hypothetical protein